MAGDQRQATWIGTFGSRRPVRPAARGRDLDEPAERPGLQSLTFRLAVTPDAAATFIASGCSTLPTFLWIAGPAGFTYLAGGSLVALGAALILGRASTLAGRFAVVIGLVTAVGYALAGDMPPFVAYLPTGLLGLAPLRSRGAVA